MLEAILASFRSPDPNTQVGACIVNSVGRVVGSGYNALPNKVCTQSMPWDREAKDPLETKYPFVVHAEKNAIYNATTSVANCSLYVTLYPCNECAKDIIQAGIKEVFYLKNPYEDTWQVKAAAKLFSLIDLPITQYQWRNIDTTLESLQRLSTIVLQ